MILSALRHSIILFLTRVNCSTLVPLETAKTCFVPALFAHADGDTFVVPHHSIALCGCFVCCRSDCDRHKEYAGDKNIVHFPGDHNSVRPEFFYDTVIAPLFVRE